MFTHAQVYRDYRGLSSRCSAVTFSLQRKTREPTARVAAVARANCSKTSTRILKVRLHSCCDGADLKGPSTITIQTIIHIYLLV